MSKVSRAINLLKSNTNIKFVCYNMHIINGDYYGE